MPGWTADGHPLLAGDASGEALVLDSPISFWGGVDAITGAIVDPRHPQAGAVVADRILVLPSARGSSSSSSVLAECLVGGSGPAAILLGEPDSILLVGAVVAAELGGPTCPIVVVGEVWRRFRTGDHVRVAANGHLIVAPGA